MNQRGHGARISDILERIARIKHCQELLAIAEENDHGHDADSAFDAILYCLLVIGEAVKSVDSQLQIENPHIKWENIIGMRDILAHQYFRIDASQVHLTIDKPLDDLRTVCERELL